MRMASMWSKLALALLLGALVPAAHAKLEKVVVTQARGTVVVDAEGRVAELNLGTDLDPTLATAVERGLRQMRFKPVRVEGIAVSVRSAFIVFLAGERNGDEVGARFDGIRFHAPPAATGPGAPQITMNFEARAAHPPRFPEELLRAGVSGAVDLAFLVAPDGKPVEVAVVRSSLARGAPRGAAATTALRALEQASLVAARQWTFDVPADFGSRPPRDRTFLTQVTYSVGTSPLIPRDGEWIELLRGPLRPIEWLGPEGARAVAGGSAGSAGATPLAGPLELLEPLAGRVLP